VEKLKSYKDLIVWQKAYQLVLLIYKITMNFPKTEMYGITSQMRRSAISIPSNFIRKDIGFLKDNDFEIVYNLCQEVSRMLNSLISSIKKRKNI